MKLIFLRCEVFNVKPAVRRFVAYWDQRVEVFGEQAFSSLLGLAKDDREAFRRYNRCRWDFPESESARYSRGRLALPEMLQQFEAEARSVEDQ